MYAAAFQNLLHSPALAWEALQLGVHTTLDAMCAPSQQDVLRHFAAGGEEQLVPDHSNSSRCADQR